MCEKCLEKLGLMGGNVRRGGDIVDMMMDAFSTMGQPIDGGIVARTENGDFQVQTRFPIRNQNDIINFSMLMQAIDVTANRIGNLESQRMLASIMTNEEGVRILEKVEQEKKLKERFFQVIAFWLHNPDAYYFAVEKFEELNAGKDPNDPDSLERIHGETDDRVEFLEALIQENPDPDAATQLAQDIRRSGFSGIDLIEEALSYAVSPLLVTMAWKVAMEVGRLPRLSSAAMMAISDTEVLPEVTVSNKVSIYYRDGSLCRSFVYDQLSWKKMSGYMWRRSMPQHVGDEKEAFATVDFLEFLDLMARRYFRSGVHVRNETRMVQHFWDLEVKHRNLDAMEANLWRRNHGIVGTYNENQTRPGWARLQQSRTGPNDPGLYRDSDLSIKGYYATGRLLVPSNMNHPMWAKLTKEDWLMVYRWANAMQPK